MDTLQPHSFKGMNETVAEMIAVDIEELIYTILEKGIEEQGFYA